MIRTRARVHAQHLIDSIKKGPKPELVDTPPPSDYRWRITVTRKQWVALVTKFAKEIDYVNYKTEANKRKHPSGFINALHHVWSDLLKVQVDKFFKKTDKNKGFSSYSSNTDSAWSSKLYVDAPEDTSDYFYVDLEVGSSVCLLSDEDRGPGEILEVGEKTALVIFSDGSKDDFDIEDLLVLSDDDFSYPESFTNGTRPEPDTFTSIDEYEDDGSWPSPEADGWMRGR